MVFSSLTFLFFFFPAVLVGYFFIKKEYANLWLLLASIAFYWIGDKQHLPLLGGVIAIAFTAGLLMQADSGRRWRRVCMVASVASMLLLMSYYKYWDFLVENINALTGKNIASRNIVFPVGISFFTFQAISYVVDVYRGKMPLKNPVDMALYISFFPQLIAGPIVRYHDIRAYMDKTYRKINFENVGDGVWRFCVGLSKKVLLANTLGGLADIVFGVEDIAQFSVLYTWLGAVAYTFQIYFDFSGYSDMAIGLGRIFGFQFKENFNYPYSAGSIRDFWRRWHMSLSQFFRDYVYIPLGGSRCTKSRWICNILCVWLLTGMWHGASWNYIVWGILYGVALILERFVVRDHIKKGKNTIFGHIYTMLFVVLLWVIFRAADLPQAVSYLKNMFGIGAPSFIDHAFSFHAGNYALPLLASAVCCMPVSRALQKLFGSSAWYKVITAIGLAAATIAAVSFVYMGSYNPFLYFMF